MKSFGVLDIFGEKKYTEYSIPTEKNTQPSLVFEDKISTILVVPKDTIRGPYLISSDFVVPNDIVANEREKCFTAEKLITRLQFGSQYGLYSNLINKESQPNDIEFFLDLITKYFIELKRYIEIKRNKENTLDSIILVIPDWVEDVTQDYLLSALGMAFPSPILLWSSVAACLGAMKFCPSFLPDNNSRIYVKDNSSSSCVTTKIEMSECSGRIIPCHHIFRDTDLSQTVRREYYPVFNLLERFDIFSNEISLRKKEGFIEVLKSPNAEPSIEKDTIKRDGYATITLERNNDFIEIGANIYKEKDLLSKGASEYFYCKINGLIPYYEECRGLYMVVVNAAEEVSLKPLVEYREKMPAGNEIRENIIEDLHLQKGADYVDFNLLFTSEPSIDRRLSLKLRTLKQNLVISDELLNAPRNVPLVLYPSVNPGQGRARVQIRQSNEEKEQVLSPVYLDWKEMKMSNKTTNDIIEELPRSFPVDIPSVICDVSKFKDALSGIMRYCTDDTENAYQALDFAKSVFVDRNAKGIDKLLRKSVFGSPKNNNMGYPPKYQKVVETLFEKMAKDYKRTYESKLLRQIAWTYHGEPFKGIIKTILREIEDAAYSSIGVSKQKITCCANLLTEDSEMISFMKSFIWRINQPSLISDWCRGAYQVLMYNSSFLDPERNKNAIKESEWVNCMKSLIIAFYENKSHKTVQNNIDRVVYAVFKARRYYSDFCKNSVQASEENLECYRALQAYVLSPKAAIAKKYIDLHFMEDQDLDSAFEFKCLRSMKDTEDTEDSAFEFKCLRSMKTILNDSSIKWCSKELWNVLNDWSMWDDYDKWFNLLKEKGLRINYTSRADDFDKSLKIYERYLVWFFDKNNLHNYTSYDLKNTLNDRPWTKDIAKILVGKGNLNIPLDDNDD